MPTTTVEITEPAKNIVEVNVRNVVVEEITVPATAIEIIEQVNNVSVAAVTRALGASTLSSALTVTNELGDAIDGLTFPEGTSLETLIRAIISPFNEPTFVSTSWVADGSAQADGQNLLVECGLNTFLKFLDIVWTDRHNLDDTTDLVVADTSFTPDNVFADIPVTDYAALDSPHRFKTPYVIPATNHRFTRVISITTGYRGDNGESAEVVPLTKLVNIYHRDRLYVVASPNSTVGSNSLDAFIPASFDVFNTLGVDLDDTPQEISVTCTHNTANSSNFTWIFIPFPGVLGAVYAEVGGGSVIDYTDSFTYLTSGNQLYFRTVGNASPRYTGYRSNQPGAFDSDVTLKIKINRYTR